MKKYLKSLTAFFVLTFTAISCSTSAIANPSDPEIFEFSFSPSTFDLSSNNPALIVRIGVRDSGEVRYASGSCETEPPGGNSGVSYQIEYWGENFEPEEIFNNHISTSGDSFEYLVESAIKLEKYDELALGVHLCKLTAGDFEGNWVERSARFTVIDSSAPATSSSPPPSSPTSPSSPSSSASPFISSPQLSPSSPSSSSNGGSGNNSAPRAETIDARVETSNSSAIGGVNPAVFVGINALLASIAGVAAFFTLRLSRSLKKSESKKSRKEKK